jgi:glycosyltransferase involved in cell wall biosynthesis
MKNNKILLVTGIYPPDIGGPATYSKLLYDEMPKRGFNIKVLSFGEVRELPKIIRHFVFFLRILWCSKGCYLIYCQDPVSVGLPASFVSIVTGKKFLIRIAGDYAWEQSTQRFGVKDTIDEFQNKKYGWKVELLRKFQQWSANRADKIITPSIYFRNLVAGWVKDKKKVITIYNGIDLNVKFNKKLDDSNKKTIISAGRLVPWKGFDVLIEVIKDLTDDWRLVIVGEGPEREALEKLINKNNLENMVKITGMLPRDQMFQVLASSDVFVLNTAFESFSFQVVEAMHAKVPVITTNIGNLSEIIGNGKEGILIEPNNKKEILGAIKKISSDSSFREMIISNASKKVQTFSINNTLDKLSEIFKSFR